MTAKELYEVTVGLEVDAQLLTQSKLFCGDSIAFGAEPNTLVSPVTLCHPGTLPKMNTKAIEFAIRDKEDADDYRHFPESDLSPFHLHDKFVERIREAIPELPKQSEKRYASALQLSEYDALLITDEK